jgi:hypothetical protein
MAEGEPSQKFCITHLMEQNVNVNIMITYEYREVILAANQADSKSFSLKIEALCSFETLVLTKNHTALSYPRKQHFSLKNVIFWDVMPSGSCKSRRFGRT